MNKKIGIIIGIIIIAILVIGGAFYFSNRNNTQENNTQNNDENTELLANENNSNSIIENDENEDENSNISSNGKILVVYYSAQTHTKAVAEKIADNINADTFEIVPTEVYTSSDLNWSDSDSRVSKEHDDESLRDVELVSTTVDNWDDYDTVLIGYPIWWGIAAWPTNTFVKANDFSGKTVIPFCTSSSSGLGQSGTLLEEVAGSGNWLEGHRFTSNPSDSDIKTWTDSIK